MFFFFFFLFLHSIPRQVEVPIWNYIDSPTLSSFRQKTSQSSRLHFVVANGARISIIKMVLTFGSCTFCKILTLTSLILIHVGLWIKTECGRLQVSPGEIVVLPQGFRFSVDLPDGPSQGYVAEVFGAHFQLPDLGPIGKWVLMSIFMLSNAVKKCWNADLSVCFMLSRAHGNKLLNIVKVLMVLLLQGIFWPPQLGLKMTSFQGTLLCKSLVVNCLLQNKIFLHSM